MKIIIDTANIDAVTEKILRELVSGLDHPTDRMEEPTVMGSLTRGTCPTNRTTAHTHERVSRVLPKAWLCYGGGGDTAWDEISDPEWA